LQLIPTWFKKHITETPLPVPPRRPTRGAHQLQSERPWNNIPVVDFAMGSIQLTRYNEKTKTAFPVLH
jgi:hypothetical protein